MIFIPMVLSIQIDWNIYAAFKSLCSVDLWANNHLRFAATFHRDEEHSVIPACIILKMSNDRAMWAFLWKSDTRSWAGRAMFLLGAILPTL